MEIDKLNYAILKVLQEQGRLSYAEIGRQVGLSAPAVAERMQKLEDSGVIRGYKADLNLEKLGLPLKAIINMKVHTGKLQAFLLQVQEMREIYECHRVTGNDCLVMKAAVRSPKNLEELVNRLVNYGDPTTSVVLSSPVESKTFLAPAAE